jgi:hypothetical protein
VARRSDSVPFSAVAVAVVVALSACGGDDETPSATKPKAGAPKTPASAIPAEVIGTWTRRFTKRDVGDSGFPTGRWVLKVQQGMIEVYEGPQADPTQDCITQEWCAVVELTGSGTTLTVGRTGTCAGAGRYAFAVKGDTLTTTRVDDDCRRGRHVLFNGRTWKRSE